MHFEGFEPGVPVQLSPWVQRIVAPNPGVMTGPGTNSYLIGREQLALLDPGPDLPEHIDAILAAADGRLRWIIATHTHPDHSPAWQAIKQATGAQVIGAKPWDDMFQDDTFAPDMVPTHDTLAVDADFHLRALHTPGHVGNHFCFLLEEEGMLFAGDHIMNGSTVVIVPPSGDMKAYIESLQLLLDYPLEQIAPGHGDLIDTPREAVNWLVEHRLGREAKVVAGLEKLSDAALDELVAVVYDDVDVGLHDMAKLSLTAHLIKLKADGRAVSGGDPQRWQLV